MKLVEMARQKRNRKDEDDGEGLEAGYTHIKVGTLPGDEGEENQKDGQAVVAGTLRSSDGSARRLQTDNGIADEVEAGHGTG